MLSLIIGAFHTKIDTSLSWSDAIMKRALEEEMIDASENTPEIAQSPITRERVAKIVERVNLSQNTGGGNKEEYNRDLILDLNEADAVYRDDIHNAYQHGLLQGSDGMFRPKDTVTRAEACAIVNRLFKYTKRLEVPAEAKPVATPKPTVNPETGTSSTDPRTIAKMEKMNKARQEREENKANPKTLISVDLERVPKEGDMFNGRPITRDPETGVLGFGNGQTGGIYNGIQVTRSYTEVNTGNPVTKTETIEDRYIFRYDGASTNFSEAPSSGIRYITKGKYTFWDFEWEKINKTARAKLQAYKESMGCDSDKYIPGAMVDGTTADAAGNIISTEYTDTSNSKNCSKLCENPDVYYVFDMNACNFIGCRG